MNLYFLEADQPITKRYARNPDGTLLKHSYPFVYNVTSHHAPVTSLAGLYAAITHHAPLGHTLVKGELQRPLVMESRAGSTDPSSKTEWICLDLDGIENFQSIDLFLEAIGCRDVDYVLQWSSSMGVENVSGFRCHIFMLLRSPTHPAQLKQWLQHLNLTVPQLRSQLALTKTANALRWPLDVTTCQNDKLLYIAPPKFDAPLSDPYLGTRISLETRTFRTLALPTSLPSKEALRQQEHQIVNELRTAANLPKRRSSKYKFQGTVEYLTNPEAATVTEMKVERGFVYLNLNGGDSFAYYHPEENPAFIYNFKGEPTFRTEDLLPEYWATVTQRANTYQPTSSGIIYLAFRDFASGNYFNGTYNVYQEDLKLAMAKSEGQLRHFMKQHGQPLGDFIPDWDMVFDPDNPVVVDPEKRILNTWRPSQYLRIGNPQHSTGIPATINRLLLHVLGDFPTRDRFLNWLACIVQFKDRTGTAWVLHGTQGTGKGLLYHQILAPLLGEWNTTAKRMEEIEGMETGFLKDKLIMFVDEVEAGKSLYHSKVTARLKNLIVEPTISVRELYRGAYMRQNRLNILFASNKNAPVEVDPDDRRFNVALRQDQPLTITAAEVDGIADELHAFYAFLKAYPADRQLARTPLVNTARATLIDTNRLSVDVLADAILAGEVHTLWDYLPTTRPQPTEMGFGRYALYERYRTLVLELVQNPPLCLSRDELHDVFEWCVGSMPESPNKFTSLLKHHRLHMKYVWRSGRSVRGIDTTWKTEPTWLAQAQADIAAGRV